MSYEIWLLVAYVCGTVFTYFFIRPGLILDSTELTIDALIRDGYLRHKKNEKGEIEILHWNHKD